MKNRIKHILLDIKPEELTHHKVSQALNKVIPTDAELYNKAISGTYQAFQKFIKGYDKK